MTKSSSVGVRGRSVRALLALCVAGVVSAAGVDASAQGMTRWGRLAEPPPVVGGGRFHHRFEAMRGRPVVTPRVVFVPVPTPAPVVAPPCAPPPAPQDAEGFLVLPTTRLSPGQAVRIHWGAGFYAGVVRAALSDGRVLVHYDGYSDLSDEVVDRAGLRLPR
jgi:hypothetical protein